MSATRFCWVLLRFSKKKTVDKKQIYPSVCIIIPVYNEATKIAAKIKNCLEFDYPDDKLEIIVVSDASTDDTKKIVKGFATEKVRFLSLPRRGGKVCAQNYAARLCRSDIVIFTDVAILTNAGAVQHIVQNFADETVGTVSCRDAIIGDKHLSRGEENYIRYDMMVRRFTSRMGSLIGVTGGFYAVRSDIVQGGWNPAYPPDFYVAIRCLKKGMRIIEDPRVVAYYKTAASEWDELPRKVRTINRGMHALLSKPNRVLLNPVKYGFTALQLFTHKLLRWLVPLLFLCVFISCGLVMDIHPSIEVFFFIQVVCYGLIVVSVLLRNSRLSLLKLLRYFAFANMAIVTAWIEFFTGKQYVMWEPTKR